MSSLNAEMRTLESALEAIQNERVAVSKILYEQQSLIAPIRRLPIVILSDLFLYGPKSTLNKDNEPLPCTRVCCRWRAVVNSIQYLWSSLELDMVFIPPTELVHLWLTRPVTPPLTIVWANDENVYEDPLRRQQMSNIQCSSLSPIPLVRYRPYLTFLPIAPAGSRHGAFPISSQDRTFGSFILASDATVYHRNYRISEECTIETVHVPRNLRSSMAKNTMV